MGEFPNKKRGPDGKFVRKDGTRKARAERPADDGRLPLDVKMPTRPAPTMELGVGGTQVFGGYLIENEKDAALKGTERYKTFSDLLANVAIIAASVRLFVGMVGNAEWKFEPANDSEEALKLAEQTEELLTMRMRTPWNRVVRRLAMFKMYGFALAEWIAQRMDDGRIGFRDVRSRPQITIERWLIDPHGEVLGFVQTDPQTGKEFAIPRAKVVYVVDDALNDSPQGLGLFRHIVDSGKRLRRLFQMEGYGYEADMRGIPIGRAPLAELDNMVQAKKMTKAKAQELLDGMQDFLENHIKNPALGLMVDSTPYRNTGEQRAVASTPQWDVSLLDGGTYSLEHIHEAIVRTQREMARVFGTEHMMLGENSSGSRALSQDKTTMFGLLVNDALTTIREQVDDDLVRPLFDLNGWDQGLRPTLKTDTQVFRNVQELTAAIRDLATAGVQVDRQDEAVQEIMDLLGLSRFEALETIDTDLVISAAQAQEDAMAIMEGKELARTNGEQPNGEGRPRSSGADDTETPDEDEGRTAKIAPRKGEKKGDFISRFMSSDAMQREYPDQDQRLAVANSKWESK